ncbi:MAG: AraC family transcriptional regulator [Planctomycetota bacterium]
MSQSITTFERFYPLEFPSLSGWRRSGVLRAGYGRYGRGWSIVHPQSDRHLVAVCIAGSGSVVATGGEQQLTAGMAWVVPAGMGQELRGQSTWQLVWWYLNPATWSVPRPSIIPCLRADLLDQAADALCGETQAPSTKPTQPPRPDHRLASEDRAWLLAGLLMCEVRRLMALAGADAADQPQLKQWRAVLASLRGDLSAPWSVVSMSKRVGVSAPTLRRLVRRQHGCSVRALIATERMARARQLLRLTDLGHAAIAEQIGYADPFAFARAFHRHEGCWPSQFRSRASEDTVVR